MDLLLRLRPQFRHCAPPADSPTGNPRQRSVLHCLRNRQSVRNLRRSPMNRENEVDIPQGLCDNAVDRRPRIIIQSTKRHDDRADRPYLCDSTKRNAVSRLTGGGPAQVTFAPGIGRSGIGGPPQSLTEYGSSVRSFSAGIRNRKRRTSSQIGRPSTYQSRY